MTEWMRFSEVAEPMPNERLAQLIVGALERARWEGKHRIDERIAVVRDILATYRSEDE